MCLSIRLHPCDQAWHFCFMVKIVKVIDILSIHIWLTTVTLFCSSRNSSPKSLSLWCVSHEPSPTFQQIVMIILTALEISGRGVFFLAFPPCLSLVYFSVKSYRYLLWGALLFPLEPWWISSGMTNPTKCQGFVTHGFEYATRHLTIYVVTALIWKKKNLLLNMRE